jgi:ABC-type Fe3+-siderophore transport system permease subunit
VNKTIVAPLLGFIFLTLQFVFKVELDEQTKAGISEWVGDGIALALVLYGIFKDHKKKVDKLSKKG